jgi:hypothetical protein
MTMRDLWALLWPWLVFALAVGVLLLAALAYLLT